MFTFSLSAPRFTKTGMAQPQAPSHAAPSSQRYPTLFFRLSALFFVGCVVTHHLSLVIPAIFCRVRRDAPPFTCHSREGGNPVFGFNFDFFNLQFSFPNS
jgi:hypothetical protein